MSKHYLLSLPMPEHGMTMHCYMMSNNEDDLRAVAAKLLEVAEEKVGKTQLPMMVSSPLADSDAMEIRSAIADQCEKTKKLLREAKDFHFSIWGMASSDPDNLRLMKLH